MTRRKLLNQALYQRLCQVFGRRGVDIHKPGQKGDFVRGAQTGHRSSYRLKRLEDGEAGEEYSVRCPICNDHAKRLYFNYRWGTRDPYTNARILWLCHCYNEECQTDYGNRLQLADLIFNNKTEVLTANEEDAVEVERRPATLPGGMQNLKLLAKLQPDHPAVQWCEARRFSVNTLNDRYGVGYCLLPGYSGSMAARRIVAPFYFRRRGKIELGGWTARAIFPIEGKAKWVHSKDATRNVVYGLAESAQYRTMFTVEGPGDKWAQKKRAHAILGKTLKAAKAKRIAKAAGNHPDQNIVVVLDPEQDKTSMRKGREHHIELACNELRKYARCRVSGLYLPEGTDPGSLEADYLWDYACTVLGEKGIRLSKGLK